MEWLTPEVITVFRDISIAAIALYALIRFIGTSSQESKRNDEILTKLIDNNTQSLNTLRTEVSEWHKQQQSGVQAQIENSRLIQLQTSVMSDMSTNFKAYQNLMDDNVMHLLGDADRLIQMSESDAKLSERIFNKVADNPLEHANMRGMLEKLQTTVDHIWAVLKPVAVTAPAPPIDKPISTPETSQ